MIFRDRLGNRVVIQFFSCYKLVKLVQLIFSKTQLFKLSARVWQVCMVAMVLSFGATPVMSAPAFGGWDVKKIDGRSYVSVDNIRKFYGFDTMTRKGGYLELSKNKGKTVVQLKLGGTECLMNNLKFVFSHSIMTVGDKAYISQIDLSKLVDPVLRPNFIKNAASFRTVILDPGHGGKDPGATNPFGTEAQYNLKVAGLVKTGLEKYGYKVVMTRSSNVYLSLQERVDLANAVRDNAIFISIHFNSGGRAARGLETFTLSPPGVSHYGRGFQAADNQVRAGNEHDSANIALATVVQSQSLIMVRDHLKQPVMDRGIKRARFSVLSGVRHPAILFEGGFMSHPHEARLIDHPRYQQALANGIVRAVRKYQNAIQPVANRSRR